MTTMLLSFVFMLLMVGGMSVGVMMGRKPITGSCGGMKALGMNVQCEICGGDPNACESQGSRSDRTGADDLARDAMRGSDGAGRRTL